MNNYLETEAKDIFSKVKARYIFRNLFLFPIYFGLILGIIIGIAGAFNSDILELLSEEKITFIIPIIYILAFGAICWRVLNRLKSSEISFKYIWGKFSLNKKECLSISIAILANQVFFLGINQLTIFFTTLISPNTADRLTEQSNPIFIYNGEDPSLKIVSWLLFFLMVVIVAPVTEEFLFRGIILHRWGTKWGIIPAILLSSFCFGLIHLNIFFISLGIWAIFLALLYIKTGSLLVPIIAHALNNFLVFVVVFLTNNGSIALENEAVASTNDMLLQGIIFIGLSIIPLFYLLKLPNSLEDLPYFTNQKKLDRVRY